MNLTDRFRGTLTGWAIGSGAWAAPSGPVPIPVFITFSEPVERVVEKRLSEADAALCDVVARFEALCDPNDSLGFGSWTGLASVALFHAFEPEVAIEGVADLLATTGRGIATADTARYLCGLIVGALKGTSKAALLTGAYAPSPGYWSRRPLVDEVADVVSSTSMRRRPPQGISTPEGCLEAALGAFYQANSFEEGYSLANRHENRLVCAMYGLLAGAYYAYPGIPGAWREQVPNRDGVLALADDLRVMAESRRPRRVAG